MHGILRSRGVSRILHTRERQQNRRRQYHHRQQSHVFPSWTHVRRDMGRSLPGPQWFWMLLITVFCSHWQDWEWMVCVWWKYWLRSSWRKSHTGFINWCSGVSWVLALDLWVLGTGERYNEVKGRLPVSYINVLCHMQGEKWHCHISDWVREVLGFIFFWYKSSEQVTHSTWIALD